MKNGVICFIIIDHVLIFMMNNGNYVFLFTIYFTCATLVDSIFLVLIIKTVLGLLYFVLCLLYNLVMKSMGMRLFVKIDS